MTEEPSDRNPRDDPGTPTWVKVFAVVVIAMIVLLVVFVVAGIGGPHGPGRHGG